MVDNCKNIVKLDLTRIPKLTEKGIEAVAKAELMQLEVFNLYANAMIEDGGFMEFAKSPYENLVYLDFCGCKFLSDESLVLMSL